MAVDNGVSIKLARTNKKRNSTRIITAFSLSMIGYMKQPTSITNPAIIIETPEDITNYNYMQIANFGRYYFIDDIVSLNNDLWEIRAHCDALASFKEQIRQNTAYILRSSERKNGDVMDMFYPTTGEVTAGISQVVQTTSYTIGSRFTEGCYVLGVIGEVNVSTSMIGQTLYILTPSQFRQFSNSLMSASSGYSWGDIAEGIRNALYNPTDYIISCYWYPVEIGSPNTQPLIIGKWNTGMTCRVLSGDSIAITYQAGIPKHPQRTRGAYLNGAPFSQYYLDLGFGAWRLDSTMLYDSDNINIDIALDVSTGIANIKVLTADGNQQLVSVRVNYGVPVNLSSSKNNIINTFTDAVGAGVAFATTGSLSAGLGLARDAMIGASDVLSGGTISNAGGNGTLSAHQVAKRLYARFFHVADDDPAQNGYPLCEVLSLGHSTLAGGYIKASFERLEIEGALESEAGDIERYVSEGFYME